MLQPPILGARVRVCACARACASMGQPGKRHAEHEEAGTTSTPDGPVDARSQGRQSYSGDGGAAACGWRQGAACSGTLGDILEW